MQAQLNTASFGCHQNTCLTSPMRYGGDTAWPDAAAQPHEHANKPWFSCTLTFKNLLQYLSHQMFAAHA